MLFDVFNTLLLLSYWLIAFLVHMLITVSLLVTITWGLLILYRLLGIPWVDGTRYGLLNRR